MATGIERGNTKLKYLTTRHCLSQAHHQLSPCHDYDSPLFLNEEIEIK